MRIFGNDQNRIKGSCIFAGILLACLFIMVSVVLMPAFPAYASEDERKPVKGWYVEDGSYHYSDGSDEPVKGRYITPSQGHAYWLNEEGILQYGVFTVDGMNYTTDTTGWIRLKNGWLAFNGTWSAAEEVQDTKQDSKDAPAPAKKKSGLYRESGIWYFIDEEGNRGNEVIISDNTAVIGKNDTEVYGEGEICSGSSLPFSDGVVSEFPDKPLQVYISGGETGFPGWIKSDDGWYFSDAMGEVVVDTVIQDASGRLFLIGKDGKPTGGFAMCNNELCSFTEDGSIAVKAEWIERDDGKSYVNSRGIIPRNQIFKVDGSTYYADNEGKLAGGFHSLGGTRRFFDGDGKMRDQKSWVSYRGNWYYVNEAAEVVSGGPIEIGGKKYIFEKTGEMKTGKIEADEMSFYYTDEKGAIYTDCDFTIDDINYHADEDGKVFVGTMYEKAQAYWSDTDYLILCNLATQRTAVFKGSKGNWRLMREMIVSTGAPINPTPKGEYKTTVHSEHFNAYGVRAWYATGFIGGLYLFHSSPYEIDSEPKVCTDSRLGIPASHGCVRMALEDAKWMYDNLPLRTKVVIY